MLSHNIALALRNARRSPVAAAVNVLTLALGLACFMVVYAFVAFWEGSERYFANADRIVVLTESLRAADGSFSFEGDLATADVVAGYLKADFPRIERTARASRISDKATASSGGAAIRISAFAVDPEFLDVFQLPFVAGDARTALASPRSVVVTRATAAQLFGDADPIGRSVRLENLVDTTVTGVVDAIPEPSHMGRSKTAALRFDLLASRDVIETIRERTRDASLQGPPENWFQGNSITYLLLPADGSLSITSLHDGLGDFVARHVPKEMISFAKLEYGLVPVRDVLMRGIDDELFLTDVGMSIASAMLLLAALVLAVACVNYANLATARAAARLREVGLRKALGARPAEIMLLHLCEAALATVAAAVLAFGAFLAAAPLLTELSGADLGAALFASASFWAAMAALVAGVTVVAGAYPAFALSRIEPARALRASRSILGPRRLATFLVGSQFAVASFLLIAVAITAMQNAALVRTGLNATADPLVIVDNTSPTVKIDGETFRSELRAFPEIRGVTEIGGLPWASFSATALRRSPEATVALRTVEGRQVGFDFFAMFDLELLAGRVFDRDHGDEPLRPGRLPVSEQRIVVDRAFTEQFGFESPEAAIDELVYASGDDAPTPLRIIGVVENKTMIFFNFGSIRATFYQLRSGLPFQVVQIARDDVGRGLERIDTVWKQLVPDVAIERKFLDDVFNGAYETYLRVSEVFSGLAAIAFLISVTGLFGTATLVTSRRVREIDVRKSHGASTRQIVAMLLLGFSKPVVIANLVAWPAAFIAARAYLKTFRDPIELGPLPFALSLAVVCAIAWLAVGSQTWRAARARPADVLRYE